MVSRFVRRVSRRPFIHAISGLCAFGLGDSHATTWTWDGNTGNWNIGTNWDLNTAPLASADTTLVFGGASGYTASNDVAAPFDLNAMTLQGSALSPITINGDPLRFVASVTLNPVIKQNGPGNVVLDLPISSSLPLTFAGMGTGLVQMKGVIGGTSASSSMNFTGAHWQLSSPQNTFEGGMNVGTGATVEVLPIAGPTDITRGAATYLGSNLGAVTINGGTLKLTTVGPTNNAGSGGHLVFGAAYPLTFGTNGGTFDLRNSDPSAGTSHAGSIGYHNGSTAQSGGDFALTLNNTALAVIRFNGGEAGLSSLQNPQSGNWLAGENALRISQFNGTGPVRIELTNGAMHRVSLAALGSNSVFTLDVPITYRGVAGGDPTSGSLGITNTGTSRTTGRLMFDKSQMTNSIPVIFEGALQVIAGNSSAGLNANLRLAGTASGHPAAVTFSGRASGSGTPLGVAIAAPTTTSGQNVFWIGRPGGGTDVMTVENGAIGILDARIRMDQFIHHGVVLDARAVLHGGGSLRIAQSLSNFSPVPGIEPFSNVGDIILRGPIEGQGTTDNDAVLDLRLPAPDAAGTIASGIPKPITNTALGNNERPFGGMLAEPAHQIIINGNGFGGLRVEANARPNALFSTTGVAGGAPMADPTSNLTKINGYLTAARLAAISGASGYLTAAPTGQTWQFPMGGEWGNLVPVGLRVTNHHPTGIDVSFAMVTGFQHNVAVDSEATLDFGAATFTYGPSTAMLGIGTLHGSGTVVASGGLNVAAGGRLAPGLDGLGTLTVQTNQLKLQGSLEINANAATADVLNVIGELVLGGTSQLIVPPTTVLAPRGYKVAEAHTRTGTFTSTVGMPANYQLDYSRPDEVWLKYTGGRQLTWTGANSSNWDQATENWSGPSVFGNTDDVFFDDSAPLLRRTVTVSAGNVSPNEITVNTSGTYSIISTANAAITGYGQLIKNGIGTLVLSGPAAFEGGLSINAGTVQTALPNSIPDIGKVRVAAGAQLNLTGEEAIEHLIVSGSIFASGPLTVGALNLQNATAFSAPLELQGDVRKSGSPLTLSQPINLGGAIRTIQVEAGTSPDLTLGAVLSNGGLRKSGPGVLILAAPNTFDGGLQIDAGTVGTSLAGALPMTGPVNIGPAGTLQLNGHTQSIAALESSGSLQMQGALFNVTSLNGSGGSIELGNGILSVAQPGNARYDGVISGGGSLSKSGVGNLGLGGLNTFTGGINVIEGSLRILNGEATGEGAITVGSGGKLVVEVASNGTPVGVPIVLNGGTLGSRLNGQMSTAFEDVTAATGTTSTILIADPDDAAFRSEIILDGPLRGSGNLVVKAGTNNPNTDNGPGFRLRGAGASDFNGTITVENRVKFELQSHIAGPFSPMGSGKLVMVAGTFGSNRNGTYSQLNLRNNFVGNTTFGNDVEINGPGLVNFGPASTGGLATNNSRIVMGNLQIGAGQIAAVNKNLPPPTDPQPIQVVQFNSVTLTGGDATFSPKTPGFGFSDFPELVLGPISETTPESGIIMDGETKLTLLGGNTYSGTTRIQRGTTLLAGPSALPVDSKLHVEAGKVDFYAGSGVSFNQTVSALSGTSLAEITNTNADGVKRDFIINQLTDTVFEGMINGHLNVIKQGAGTLQLVGANNYTGTTVVSGGTLSVSSDFLQGSIAFSVLVQAGATLKGYGSVGALTVGIDGHVAPGNSSGILTTTGMMLEGGAFADMELNGTVVGSGYDQFDVSGAVTLNGLVILNLKLGFDPQDHIDTFTLILNDGIDSVAGTGRFLYGPDVLENGDRFVAANGPWAQMFEIRYDGNDGNDVVLLAVPEPSSALLILGGLGVMARRRRRRR